jgi:cytidylate kinase
VKIFLTADLKERAKRIHLAERSLEPSDSIETSIQLINERKQSEISRYMEWYKFNPYELKCYDIVYDSTGKNVEQMISELYDLVLAFKG